MLQYKVPLIHVYFPMLMDYGLRIQISIYDYIYPTCINQPTRHSCSGCLFLSKTDLPGSMYRGLPSVTNHAKSLLSASLYTLYQVNREEMHCSLEIKYI